MESETFAARLNAVSMTFECRSLYVFMGGPLKENSEAAAKCRCKCRTRLAAGEPKVRDIANKFMVSNQAS